MIERRTETILREAIDRWLSDPESDVEYAERLEDRWAVRMRQQARDATTVWFDPGPRSLQAEAYVMPAPHTNAAAIHGYLLRKNDRAWRCFYALDRDGAVVVRGRLPAASLTTDELDLLLGEIYDVVESSFRALIRMSR